ncbi:MAG TPA: NAD(P)-binding domain-containing protein [Pyrinomonadaceae bacterium]|jgi:thioredoxin reductase|nr:NAD(P)-binding domain-containing protein [Pyrinomonadaceae bacterium]
MKKSQLFVILALLALLMATNLLTKDPSKGFFGGLPWWGWAGIALFLLVTGVAFALRDSRRARLLLEEPVPAGPEEDDGRIRLTPELLERYDPEGPDYPHPVVVTERCIGCHACVDACPHDVLAIVNGIATPVARDQCMEDTSCQVECPVNPKACIVVNTTKKIPPRKVPDRDARFMTNVAGCYIVGDVSGTPLIKNATNEGTDCVRHIHEELRTNGAAREPKADVEVAIIGAGPAGLSAAITAQRLGLSYVAVEQDRALATIEAYPANKYVFFKPETMESRGGLRVEAAGAQREAILEEWRRAARDSGVRVNESEGCKSVRRAADGDYFVVETERGAAAVRGAEKESVTYRPRRVVLALGLRGTPMRLRVPGEDLKVVRDGVTYDKVMHRLTDAGAFRRKRVVVVGAGNSAIEAAVSLVATREGDRITFRPESEANDVTLVIRSDMKNDLKFGNKLQVYECIDEGRIKVFFGTTVKEIRDAEVVLQNARTGEAVATVPNDFIFAMIGGDRPTKFLESIGIRIG